MYYVVGEMTSSSEGTSVSYRVFYIFINDLKVEVNIKLMKFTYCTKLGGVANTSNGKKIIGRDQPILETWA